MAPLTANAQRATSVHTIRLEAIPVKASTAIYDAALVNSDANGLAVPAADAASVVFRGVAHRGFDNSDGADGVHGRLSAERVCEVDTNGPYSFAVNGSAPKGGETAYVYDDNTVSLSGGSHNVKCGKFTEPDPFTSGNWFVDVEAAQVV